MKKTTFFLMLTLCILSVASVNGQVIIGSDVDPHPDAVLELKSDSRGLLLSHIALKGATDFLVNGGDKAAAAGMLVYNTSDKLDGPGLYVWTGSAWRSTKPGECPVPGKTVAHPTFSPVLTNTIVLNTLITVTSGLAPGASSFLWTVPPGFEIVGDATGKAIQMRAMQTGSFDASKVTVRAVNYCGEGDTICGLGTITVNNPTKVPDMPTLTLPTNGTDLNPGDQFTITCGDVGADEYIWTLPDGVTPVSGTITATNSIALTFSLAGIYEANTFKVKAKNSKGESGDRAGSGGKITAQNCSKEPSDAYIANVSGKLLRGVTFSCRVVVASKGRISYQWTLPQGLSIVSGDNTSVVTISCDRTGTYNGSDIKVTITNDCGSTTVSSSGIFTVISHAEGSAGTLEGANATYTTYKYPYGLGTWMTQNSKEGNPVRKTFPNKKEGERGYYYTASEAADGCSDGWTLPSPAQFTALWSYLKALTSVDEQNTGWLREDVFAGTGNTGNYWDEQLNLHTTASPLIFYVTKRGTYSSTTATNSYSVRCIKEQCDDVPAALSQEFSYLPTVVVPNGIDTVWIIYPSVPNVTVNWEMTAGATITQATDNMVILKYDTEGTFDWNNLSCTLTNSCGATTIRGTGECLILSSLGSADEDLIIGNNHYGTWTYPDGLGTWMIDAMRELPADITSGMRNEDGSFGFYYSASKSENLCPAGWTIPSYVDASRIMSLWLSQWKTTGEMVGNFSGHYLNGAIRQPEYPHIQYMWTNARTGVCAYRPPNSYIRVSGTSEYAGNVWYPVFCVKSK
jgi:hypothetical protein